MILMPHFSPPVSIAPKFDKFNVQCQQSLETGGIEKRLMCLLKSDKVWKTEDVQPVCCFVDSACVFVLFYF